MSEIKGQLLGILLVTAIFATVAAAVKGVFTTLSNEVSSQVAGDVSLVKPAEAIRPNENNLLTY